MTGVLLIVSNIFFLVLFSSLFAAEGDRNRFFNPYILWTERITGPIGRFASDIVPGTSARVAAGVALLFLLAFRGALLNHAGDQQAILIGSTVSYLPRAGGAGAIVFSALHFATFLLVIYVQHVFHYLYILLFIIHTLTHSHIYTFTHFHINTLTH